MARWRQSTAQREASSKRRQDNAVLRGACRLSYVAIYRVVERDPWQHVRVIVRPLDAGQRVKA